MKRLTTDEFIRRAKDIHRNKYESNYISLKKRIIQ